MTDRHLPNGDMTALPRWASRMITPGAAVILDTETTDLYGAIIEIAVIDASSGATLLNTLIDPGPEATFVPEAVAVHGITPDHVRGAPDWFDVWPHLAQVTDDRAVLAYNAPYDHAVICIACSRRRIHPGPLGDLSRWHCLMSRQRLSRSATDNAALDGGHRALSDVHKARTVLLDLAQGAAA